VSLGAGIAVSRCCSANSTFTDDKIRALTQNPAGERGLFPVLWRNRHKPSTCVQLTVRNRHMIAAARGAIHYCAKCYPKASSDGWIGLAGFGKIFAKGGRQ